MDQVDNVPMVLAIKPWWAFDLYGDSDGWWGDEYSAKVGRMCQGWHRAGWWGQSSLSPSSSLV